MTIAAAVLSAAADALGKLKALASKDQASPLHGGKPAAIERTAGRLHLADNPAAGEDYAAIVRCAGLTCVPGAADAKPGSERKRYAFCSFGAVFAKVRADVGISVVGVARLCRDL